MTLNDMTPPQRTVHEHTWQTLIEFELSGEPGSEGLAVGRVAEAVQRLNWSMAHLEQLKLALGRATWNVMERSRLYNSEAPLIIRVLIPKDDEVTQEADQAGNEPDKGRASKRVTQQASPSPSRGWGFFLVQKQEDDPQSSTGRPHHTIELFLYREREHSRKHTDERGDSGKKKFLPRA